MTTATKTSANGRSRRMARTPSNSGANNEQTIATKPNAGVGQAGAEGATLHQMVRATGWLPHTTRAALTGLKKKGHLVTSEKLDGVRTYRVAPSGNA